jgi:hypothetical protein
MAITIVLFFIIKKLRIMARSRETSPRTTIGFAWLITICFVVHPFVLTHLSAQDSLKTPEKTSPVALDEGQWRAVVGIFQNAQNKEMYVQFSEAEGVLRAKLLWNNNEIHLIPQTPLAFVSKESGEEGPIHVTFIKDSSGGVNQVNVANNGIWNRANNYTPVIKMEMAHTPEQLRRFEGLYQLHNENDRFIEFKVKDNKLILKQYWDGNEIYFVPESSLDFFSKEVPMFSLQFSQDSVGNIQKMVAFKRDIWYKLKRTQPTMQDLKSAEGKYQSKDDPDDVIQLIARGNNLVVKQLWDGKEIMVEPQTATYFYNGSQSFPLQIHKDINGATTQVTLLGVDVFNKMR